LVPLLAIALAVTAVACSDPEPDPAPPTTVDPPPVAGVAGVQLSEVDVGRAPRQSLLVDQSAVQVWDGRLDFTLDVGTGAATAGGPSTVSMDASSDGTVSAASSGLGPLDVEVGGPNPASVPAALEYAMTFEVTPSRVVNFSDTSVSQSPQLADVALQLGEVDPELPWFILPVPQEPVGRGASWELSGDLVLFGATFDFAATIRVEAIRTARYRLAMDVELTLPGPEPTRLTGTGEVEGVPDRLVPERAEISVTGDGRTLELSIRRR
jgi:hypothetical protein